MTRSFWSATAEQVMTAIEAVVVSKDDAAIKFVADFSDLPTQQTESALNLATDLGLLKKHYKNYKIDSPLCRFIVTPKQMQKAAVLRIILESYEPFLVFRERLIATDLADTAAKQTQVYLDLNAHREIIKDTLISLGTYSHSIVTEGGGRYKVSDNPIENTLENLAQACGEAASAESRIREQIGLLDSEILSREEVIIPLSDALRRAIAGDSKGSIVNAGNAVESFLDGYASRSDTVLTNANGINAKLEKLLADKKLPRKMVFFGKYLGHIRNAADHGIDNEVNASWSIRPATGLEYVYVACSFIAACRSREEGRPPEL